MMIALYSSLAAVAALFAQRPERQDRRILLSQVKVESFDWYSTSEIAEPRLIKNYYRRGLPEGESANFPNENSSRQKDPEKFIYRIRLRNRSDKEIVSVVWHYEFVNPLTKERTATLEFESRERIKPRGVGRFNGRCRRWYGSLAGRALTRIGKMAEGNAALLPA